MTRTYLKKATRSSEADTQSISGTVQDMLHDMERGGEETVKAYAKKLDHWEGDIVVSQEDIETAKARLDPGLKADIEFAYDNIRRFAEAQMATIQPTEIEIRPGFWAGQKHIPVSHAGCYVPGGRYNHIASALMTVTTAKVAGVEHITACSPPKPGVGISDAVLFTMDLCGANRILNLGGVQGIAAMTYGYFGAGQSSILVGPGNQYVAEAKRLLFGQVGIDMVAGPTDSLVIADVTATAETVAVDLASQAEHGGNSPVWLVTDQKDLAEEVMKRVPELAAGLPDLNGKAALDAWTDYAEVILCDTSEEMAQVADEYAPEHLHVHASDLDWWLERLRNYGSLFLGEETTVSFGDKCAGPNHVLPTSGAAKYTGGLSVQKFTKTVTWQRATRDGARPIAEATARISRAEGMHGHAMAADIRI